MTTAPTCIIAYASEDNRYLPIVEAAIDTARQAEARLILYDIDAAPGGLGQTTDPLAGVPLPTIWGGDTDAALLPDRLDVQDLEYAGRHSIAHYVTEARHRGVETFGWLPSSRSASDLIAYAEEQGADLIMIPRELEDPSLIERLRGETAEKARQSPIPIALVDQLGRVEYPEHKHPHEARSLHDSAADAGRLPR